MSLFTFYKDSFCFEGRIYFLRVRNDFICYLKRTSSYYGYEKVILLKEIFEGTSDEVHNYLKTLGVEVGLYPVTTKSSSTKDDIHQLVILQPTSDEPGFVNTGSSHQACYAIETYKGVMVFKTTFIIPLEIYQLWPNHKKA